MALWIAAAPGCGRLGYTTIDPEIADGGGGTGGTSQAEAGGATGGVGGGTDAAGGTAGGASGAGGSSGAGGAGGSGGTGGTGGSVMPGTDAGVDRTADLPPDAPMPGTDAADACVNCASNVSISQSRVTPFRGTPMGGMLVASCLMQGVLIGFEGTQARNQTYPWLQSAAGICGIITVTGAGSAATVSITETAKLSTLGSSNGSAWVRRCPTNQVLVGFEGTSAGWIGVLGFRCASMLPAADGSFAVGPVTTLPEVGAPSGSPFPTTDCPAGEVAIGEQLGASTWLDGFGFICGKFVRNGF